MNEDELKSELEVLEYEEYEKSGSEDDFQAWKMKQYVDERITQIIVAFIVGAIVAAVLLKIF